VHQRVPRRYPLSDPNVEPLSADLSGSPSVPTQAATGDDRLAYTKVLAIRGRVQGVDVRLEAFPVDAHAFQLFWSSLPEAADAMDMAGRCIRKLYGLQAHPGATTNDPPHDV
jgi:acetyl esterase/lipase